MTEREQLRDRLAALMPWGDVGSFDAVDAILAEIEAAGYVLMELDRAERQASIVRYAHLMAATASKETRAEFTDLLMHATYTAHAMGDLDPLEGGE